MASLRTNAAPLTTSTSTSPSAAAGPDISLSSSTFQSSLKSFNDYIQKHYEQFVEHESLERNRLVATFAEKEHSYQSQISALETIHTDISGPLAREQSTNAELRQKLDIATSSISRLCKMVADLTTIFVVSKRGLHEVKVKQEGCSQENTNVPDINMCPNPAISSLLSQIETIVAEMKTGNCAGLPSTADYEPYHSIIVALGKVTDSLCETQRSLALLLKNFKSVDATRADAECRNESLRGDIALLQEELEQTRNENKKIARELAAVRLEKEKHVCKVPASTYPIPVARHNLLSLPPSPPLEKRDFPLPNDVSPDAPERETINTSEQNGFMIDALPRMRVKSLSSTTVPATQSGSPKSVAGDQQNAGLSIPRPPAPVQGVKRASNGTRKCQHVTGVPPPTPSTSVPAAVSKSDKTSDPRLRKKRRINCASGAAKNKLANENPTTDASTTHASSTATDPPSASSWTRNAMQLPKTNAADLKFLKFNKASQISKSPLVPALVTSSNVNAQTELDQQPMRPLDLARKSPQERATLRKAK